MYLYTTAAMSSSPQELTTKLGGRYCSIPVLCAGDLEFYFELRTLIVFVIFVILVESGERIKTISFRTYDGDIATA
jgi:hypothetical protein